MEWQIRPLDKLDAPQAVALMQRIFKAGEVLYKPLEEKELLARFFGDSQWAFGAWVKQRLVGWIHGAGKTSFLPGENAANTPVYLNILLVDAAYRRHGIGTALLQRLIQAAQEAGKGRVTVAGGGPVQMTWLIPGAGGHDHNNAPGVEEDCMGYPFLLSRGFQVRAHEVAMYRSLKDYCWPEAMDGQIAALAAKGIRVGRWRPEDGAGFDRMCDRIGQVYGGDSFEYWRGVLREETAAWRENRPNGDPALWPDGIKPTGPRPLLTAIKDGQILGFTGPVDLQRSGRGWFTGICVDPDWGGRGIATVLFNLLLREFSEEGAAFCSLFTGQENHAQKIYRRAGLQMVARFAAVSRDVNSAV